MTPTPPAAQVFSGTRDGLVRRLAGADLLVCGIVNVTPDSFYDGGRFDRPTQAVDYARSLVAEGADMLDIGGESTRPGSRPPSVAEEIDRVIPVVEALAGTSSVPISVDTSRPEVMREAVAAGAVMINDVRALQRPGALEAAAGLQVPVCLMHMQGEPETMQTAPSYYNVVGQVHRFLRARIEVCRSAGIAAEHIVIDPGFGFGKTLTHNLSLLVALRSFADLGYPVMAGLSRKSMLGVITDRDVADRLPASVAAAVIAAQHGASILRVHDVAATVDAVAVMRLVNATRAAAPKYPQLM